MDRGRVGEDRGSKETDGCPLTRAKVYAAVDSPVSTLTSHRQYTLTNTLTVRPMFDAEDAADMHHQPV
jgi:hypothetical protein